MHAIKRELEDLGFRALYPKRYKVIETAVKAARGNHKQFVGRIAASLKDALDAAPAFAARSRAARRTSTASTRRCGARRSR